jgi:hypothetical protein
MSKEMEAQGLLLSILWRFCRVRADCGWLWPELRNCRVAESGVVEVSFGRIWEDVDRRLSQLKEAQELVVEDPEILSGTPVIRGTRIPVYDVASQVDAGTSIAELKRNVSPTQTGTVCLGFPLCQSKPSKRSSQAEELAERD